MKFEKPEPSRPVIDVEAIQAQRDLGAASSAFVIVAVAALVLGLLMYACSSSGGEPDIDLRGMVLGDELILTSPEAVTFSDCMVVINRKFVMRGVTINQRNGARLYLPSFVDGDSRRFDPSDYRAEQVSASCKMPTERFGYLPL